MEYFSALPFLTTTDGNGNSIVLRNLLVRTGLIPQLAKNPLLMYRYAVQDGDTPEIVANKYYGSPFRYWITMYGNPQMMDPQSDWPMSSQQFLIYLQDKYGINGGHTFPPVDGVTYARGEIHHYEKVITTIDNTTKTTAIKVVEVDQDTYNSITPLTTTSTFPDGSSITYTVEPNAVSIYTYEDQANEAKRNIDLINSTYASAIETQYQSLVSL
jgi:hypothetical protein